MHPQSISTSGFRRTVNSLGYVLIKIDRRWVLEHRWVMSQMIGRPLERRELVHHLDGERANNDPGNLAIVTPSEHQHLHKHSRRPWGSVLHPERYGLKAT